MAPVITDEIVPPADRQGSSSLFTIVATVRRPVGGFRAAAAAEMGWGHPSCSVEVARWSSRLPRPLLTGGSLFLSCNLFYWKMLS
jgi:hypothetical protein